MTERLVGVDPSLSSTGIAVITRVAGHGPVPTRIFLTAETFRIPATGTGPLAESERVASIVHDVCSSSGGALRMTIEGLALNSRTGKYAERAHLFYALVAACAARRWAFEVVAPTSLKKQVTGNGRASKEDVLDAVRAGWGDAGWDDGPVTGRFDRADASALAWVSAGQMGWAVPALPEIRASSKES